MGFWDALCLVCGVAPSGGAQALAGNWQFDKELEAVVAELRRRGVAKELSDMELLEILKDGFGASTADNGALPRGYGQDDYCQNYVGVGYWDDSGEFGASRNFLIPDEF